MSTSKARRESLEALIEDARSERRTGQMATYIPELSASHPARLALALCSTAGELLSVGDDTKLFSLHGISASLGLLHALEELGEESVLSRVLCESVASPVDLLELDSADGTRPRPRSALSDAGAIVVCSMYPGEGLDARFESFLGYARRLCGRNDIAVNPRVHKAELAVGHRYRAIAWRLMEIGAFRHSDSVRSIDFIEDLLDLYCRQMALLVTVRDLAYFSAVLSNGGRDLLTGEQIASQGSTATLLGAMLVGGLGYRSGSLLRSIGFPAICGVSGGLAGAVPGRMGVAAYSPMVDQYGLSVRGSYIFERLAVELDLGMMQLPPAIEGRANAPITNHERPRSRGGSSAAGYSCFISYSHLDEEFAERLYERLKEDGIRAWYAPEDMQGGRKLEEQITEAIGKHDKLLLVLSESSMQSEWVEHEIRQAREREQSEGIRVLFPLRIVSYDRVRSWKRLDSDTGQDIARGIREYYILDFSLWGDPEGFEKAYRHLRLSLSRQVESGSW